MVTQTDGLHKVILQKSLVAVLRDASRQRGKRGDFVPDGPGVTVPGWVLFERDVMRAAVDVERAARGLSPVEPDRVTRAERLACGHVDYVEKYALYCAEMALGEDP
jgi:hypothetical protein